MRTLQALGLLDAVLQKLPPGSLSSKGFLFYSGAMGEHKLIYDVRLALVSDPSPWHSPLRSRSHTRSWLRSTRPHRKTRASPCTGESSPLAASPLSLPGGLHDRFQFLRLVADAHRLHPYRTPHPNPESHRATFLDALVDLVDPNQTHFNKRCTSVSEHATRPGRLVVHFADGSTHEADVVLGADGIKSAVRGFVVGDTSLGLGGIAFSNTTAYRGLIPHAPLKAAGFSTVLTDRPACFVGPGKVSEQNAEPCGVSERAVDELGAPLLPLLPSSLPAYHRSSDQERRAREWFAVA